MIYNHLFWMAVALFLFSTISIKVFLEYKESIKILPYVIGTIGMLGMVGGFIRLISLSVAYNWWWFLGVSAASLITIGILAHFSRMKWRLYVGILNIALIPFIWWYGSRLNNAFTCEYFYDFVETVRGFFA